MNRISTRTVNTYMKALVRYARSVGDYPMTENTPELAFLFSRPDFQTVAAYMDARGLIDVHRGDERIVALKLTKSGLFYFEDRAEHRRRFWTNSIIVPILVSIITAFVTVYILPTLGKRVEQWFRQTPPRTERSAPTASPSDGPSENLWESRTTIPSGNP